MQPGRRRERDPAYARLEPGDWDVYPRQRRRHRPGQAGGQMLPGDGRAAHLDSRRHAGGLSVLRSVPWFYGGSDICRINADGTGWVNLTGTNNIDESYPGVLAGWDETCDLPLVPVWRSREPRDLRPRTGRGASNQHGSVVPIPSWSPDGNQDRVRANGRHLGHGRQWLPNQIPLTGAGTFESDPEWSPDGTQITYATDTGVSASGP